MDILAAFALLGSQGFGGSQTGMSDGTVSDVQNHNVAIVRLLCCYFSINAKDAFATYDEMKLRKYALVAHLSALVAFGIACSEAHGLEITSGMITLGVVMAVCFLFWSIVWVIVFSKAASQTEGPAELP